MEVIKPVLVGQIGPYGFRRLRVRQKQVANKKGYAPCLTPKFMQIDLPIFIHCDRCADPFEESVAEYVRFEAHVRTNEVVLTPLGSENFDEPAGWIIVWELNQGLYGTPTWTHSNNVRVLVVGQKPKGIASRIGGADVPIVFVPNNELAILRWESEHLLYGVPIEWVAAWQPFQGMWHASPLPKYR